MRIWDIDPGFLNNQSLLGEHRELHGIFAIITKGLTGYSRHPETRRWVGHLPALCLRHELLVAEMHLRGFKHQSPLPENHAPINWPTVWIDPPADQFSILRRKYTDKKEGRIPLPKNIQQLWAAHKYSIMARDYNRVKSIGREVSANHTPLAILAAQLVELLRTAPTPGQLINSVQHMWGYVSHLSTLDPTTHSPPAILQEIQRQAQAYRVTYLLHSTALGELSFWCKDMD